jgi:hypothetical protein
MPSATMRVLDFRGTVGGNVILTATLSNAGNLTLGGGTGSATLQTGQWYLIEVKCVRNGASELRVNGISASTATAANTDDPNFVLVGLFGVSGTGDVYFDDIALRDDDWVGQGPCNILKATGNGYYTDWTGSYADVDEVPHDSDTTYITSSTVGHAETVTIEDVATVGAWGPVAVKPYSICRRDPAAGSFVPKVRVRSGGVDWDAAQVSISSAYTQVAPILNTDPATSAAWTPEAIDNLEVGILNGAAGTGRCTSLSAMVWCTGNLPPSVVGTPAITYAHGTSTHEYSTPFEVEFTAEDGEQQGADALAYQIRTGANRTGTLVASGTCTHGVPESVAIAYDASGLVDGSQTLYLSVDDGLATSADASFTVVRRIGIRSQLELQWRSGGRISSQLEFQWRQGGRISSALELQWRVEPSANRVARALRTSPVVYGFRYERRTPGYQLVDDVTPAIAAASIELNNDRTVLRTASFVVDASARTTRGEPLVLSPLRDHIAVIMELLVDGSYLLDLPMGLFALHHPRKRITPAGETWDVDASDLSVHLLSSTTTAPYTVAAGTNYIAASAAILDALGLRHLLPSVAKTLPVAMTWDLGAPWLTVVNGLLHACNLYSLWFDAQGVAKTRVRDSLSERTPDTTYSDTNELVLSPVEVESEDTRFANQVVAFVDDPSRPPLSSVATNADPASPISTVSLGRTITKTLQVGRVADQATLDAIAQRELEDAASLYERATLLTPIDPRRDAHEVYRLDISGVYDGSAWWARNWSVELRTGAQMKHTLGRVQRVVAA